MDALGKRLADSPRADVDDLGMLEEILRVFGTVLNEVRLHVGSALQYDGLAFTSRVKTTTTIVQKLQRDKKMALKGMRDLAGLRLVRPMSRVDQDDLVDALVKMFPGDPRPPRVVDRRREPAVGYRAVHVVVSTLGLNVEIQVRTELQDLWANSFELLADRWGRELRYGAPLAAPETVLWPGQERETTRGSLFAAVVLASDSINTVEETVAEGAVFARQVPVHVAALKRAQRDRTTSAAYLFRMREVLSRARELADESAAAYPLWQERHTAVVRELERLTTDVT